MGLSNHVCPSAFSCFLSVYVILFTFSVSNGITRSLSTPQTCEREAIGDCSSQLPDGIAGTCLIYGTSACKTFDFSKWSLTTLKTLEYELDAKFSVSIIPYGAELHEIQRGLPVSAINITFTIFHEGINGFAVLLHSVDYKRNDVCRIIDFRNLTKFPTTSLDLFYDCFYNLVEDNIQNVRMNFKALPMNEELSYLVFIPSVKVPGSICEWQPLIMVFCGSLETNAVQVKFSVAPEHLNVLSYLVILMSAPTNESVKVLKIPVDPNRDMMSVEFTSVDEGYYSIIVSAVTDIKRDCRGVETVEFFVGSTSIGKVMMLYIGIIVSLVISLTLVVKILLHWIFKPVLPTSKPHLLLVYSHDCIQHEELISAFMSYLITHCNVNVSTIYGSSGNPTTWIEEKYLESDVIMFIISEGFFHTVERKNVPCLKEGHYWWGQLSVAVAFISAVIFDSRIPGSGKTLEAKKKKFCKVCFPYSSEKCIPKSLDKGYGNCYFLPSEMNTLLCFIFDCFPKIPCTKIYPKIPGHNIKSADAGKTLEVKITDMKKAVGNNAHLQYHISKKQEDTTVEIKNSFLTSQKNNPTTVSRNCETEEFFKTVIFSEPGKISDFTEKEYDLLLNHESEGDSYSSDEDYLRSLFREELQKSSDNM